MQTFLPYPNFEQSAQCLDYQRLGKQRVECRQILNSLAGGKGWAKHPATCMWRGYEKALTAFMNACIREWMRRGYKNTMPLIEVGDYVLPPWFGDAQFHASHQAALLYKNYAWYRQFGWSERPALAYIWPAPGLASSLSRD